MLFNTEVVPLSAADEKPKRGAQEPQRNTTDIIHLFADRLDEEFLEDVLAFDELGAADVHEIILMCRAQRSSKSPGEKL